MKEYCVSVDITMATHLYVEAENEEEAKRMVEEKIKKSPFYYASKADAHVGSEIVDVIDV